MTRLTELKIGLGAAGALLLALLLAGPGCGRGEDQAVRARNLLTGEIGTFASEGDVPQDWVVCQSEDCPVPPSVPCQQLSDKVCTLNPACRLKELWCTGTVTTEPDGDTSDGSTPPGPPPTCEYECIPKLPLLCEELSTEQQCKARPDCDWAQLYCPAMACAPDQPDCEVPCPFTCVTKAPPICQTITDETQCQARPDCEWEQLACTMECIDDGKGGCLPCPDTGSCRPKTPVPPPCPAIAPPPPGFCPGGKIVYDTDASGCVTGYHCEMPQSCWDLNTAYVNAVKQAKACNPFTTAAFQQCSKQVNGALFCPVCPTFINPGNTVAVKLMTDLEQKWLALGCDKMEVVCPAIACATPQSATCLPSSAGTSAGSCVDDQPAP